MLGLSGGWKLRIGFGNSAERIGKLEAGGNTQGRVREFSQRRGFEACICFWGSSHSIPVGLHRVEKKPFM